MGNWPSGDCASKRIVDPYKCGIAAAKFAYGHAVAQHAYANTWWIDVEYGNKLWGNIPSHAQDKAFLYGMAHELKSKSIQTVGYYSTQDQWNYITGGWKPNAPTWYASPFRTSNTPAHIKDYCRVTFGSSTVNAWVQYVHDNPDYPKYPFLDVDVHC